MINLLKFNGKLISNGLAAMSLDCKYSKLPGNMFFSFVHQKQTWRKEKEGMRKLDGRRKYVCDKSLGQGIHLHHDKCKALVAVRESLTQADSSCKMPHSNSVQHNSVLVHSVGYLRISD